MLIGLVTVVPFIVTVLFCIRDVEAVQQSFNPMIEVFLQATGSRAAATVLQSCLTLLFFCKYSLVRVDQLLIDCSCLSQLMDNMQSHCLGLFQRRKFDLNNHEKFA